MSGPMIVVMAAGLGSRYGGHKQVVPIGPRGEWIIDYSVYDALRAGFERVVFVVRAAVGKALRDRFDRVLAGRCPVDYVEQSLDDMPPGSAPPSGRSKPWGTGHAVWCCRGVIDRPFAVINADDFYGCGAFTSLARFLKRDEGAHHALVGYRLAHTLTPHGPVSRGICQVDEAGRLVEIMERHGVAERGGRITASGEKGHDIPLSSDAIVSMNMWGFAPSFLAALDARWSNFLAGGDLTTAEFSLPDVVQSLIAGGSTVVRVLPTEERWFGMTYRDDLERARDKLAARIASGAYPTPLWADAP